MAAGRRILALTIKELRQLSRDKLTFGMIVGIPALQLVLFGYAINFDVRHLPAAIADEAHTTYSRQLVQDIAHSQVVDVRAQVGSGEELTRLIERGEVRVGVLLPKDLEQIGRAHV